MTVSYVRPIVPDTSPGKVSDATVRAAAEPLPLIAVPASRPVRLANVLYRIAAVDHRGRVADRHITAALDWNAGTRLSIREHNGLLVVWGAKTWLNGLDLRIKRLRVHTL